MNKDSKSMNAESSDSKRNNITPKKSYRRKRKRVSDSSDTENEEAIIDKAIDESIKAVAAKNDITPDIVKKILKKLVLNEHVLAIVKLQEEEEENTERKDRKIKNTLKLTRSKARELNQKPFPITPFKNSEPNSEVTALIRDELGVSDDEDVEYQPNEDEIHSDDNTTISDIDSQPMTPATPKSYLTDTDYEEAACSYTDDGVFKIPTQLFGEHGPGTSATEQENIARRTRSKLCLQTTSIESIESTFVPPDITTDMYDFDADIDNVWKEFLNEFTQPLKTNTEEDDETDPEYVACDNEIVDEEELRQVRVSKKELSDLVTELFDMVGNIDETLLDDDVPMPAQPQIMYKPNEIIITPNRDVNTPEEQPQSEAPAPAVDPLKTMISYSFNPNIASTPHTRKQPKNTQSVVHIPYQQSVAAPPPIFVQNPNNQNELIPIKNFDFNSNTYKDTEGIIKLEADTSTVDVEPTPINMTDDLKRVRYVQNTAFKRNTRGLFDFVKQEKKEINENIKGFSEHQLKMLQQQMRMHVQLTTQNFIQTYAHPEYWHHANKFKAQLKELKDLKRHETSYFNAWNLDLAIKFCDDWEKNLLNLNEENTSMIHSIIEEVSKEKERYQKTGLKNYVNKFANKIMQTMLTSKVFIYPELLPARPFKALTVKSDLSHHEEYLIANSLAVCYKKLQDILKKYQEKPREPALLEVCREVVRTLCPFRKATDLYQSIRLRKKPSYGMNPIKFYFIHNQAPILKTDGFIELDFENIHPPLYYPKILPHCWKQFHKRFENIPLPTKDPTINNSVWINSETKEILLETRNVKEESPASFELSVIESEPESDREADLQSYREQPTFVDFKVEIQQHYLTESVQNYDLTIPPPDDASTYDAIKSEHASDTELEQDDDQEINFKRSASRNSTNSQNSKFSLLESSSGTNCNCCYGCIKYKQEKSDRYLRRARESYKRRRISSSSIEVSVSAANKPKPRRKRLASNLLTKRYKSKKAPQPQPKLFVLKKKSIILKSKLHRFLWQSNTDYDKENFRIRIQRNLLLETVYKHIKAIDIFSSLLIDLKVMASNAKRLSDGDVPTTGKKIKVQDGAEQSGGEGTSARDTNKKQFNKKLGTAMNKGDSDSERDHLYAYNFFEKVEETLLDDNKLEEYERFQSILQNFDHSKDRVSDLYHKIENLLASNYPELLDVFLTFLGPGQAAEVGRFFEHFILTNMTTFLEKLNIYFNKQPTQIKKIHLCLAELSDDENVTIEQVKAKIIPLLRGNQLLTAWFLELFPEENPTSDIDDLSDYETIHLNKKTSNCEQIDASEVYEELLSTDIAADLTEPSCGVKYMNGRINYGILPKMLPAKLSFLAQDCMDRLNKMHTTSVTEATEGGVKCVHAIKNYGDKLLEKNKFTTSDSSDINSSHSDGDELDFDQSAADDDNEEPAVVCHVDQQPLTVDVHKSKKKQQKLTATAENVQSRDNLTETGDENYKLCDANALKAHALRLNPRASGEKFEDYAHFLSPTSATPTTPNANEKPTTDDESQSKSPKKISGKTAAHKLKPASPNNPSPASKKSIHKSPNITKKISFVNSTDDVDHPETGSLPATVEIKKETVEEKPTEMKNDWTRDEDRIILETIQKKIALMTENEAEILHGICDELDNRNLDEVTTRYEFLKDLFMKHHQNQIKTG